VNAATTAFRQARDQLVGWYGRHEDAVAGFTYPDVGGHFNWAVDWFDPIARGVGRDALVVLGEDGSRETVSFDHMAERSDQTAHWLAELGVGKGDPVLVMLGNQVELWSVMLGVMKLGAVIVPTATAAGPSELNDRLSRTGAKAVVCNEVDASKFDEVDGDYLRIVVGQRTGWHPLTDADHADSGAVKHPGTSPQDPLLLYFTSGTTSKPKLAAHTQVSYPVGHLSTMYWVGLKPGDVHLNISSPGWAKHAWSCLFAPWNAEATVVVYNYARFDATALLDRLRSEHVTSFCAPPTVWRMLINADLGDRPLVLRELVGAGEPLNPEVITQVQKRWALTIRDGFGQTETTCQIGNTPGSHVKPGSMGRPLPGIPSVLVDQISGALVEGMGEGEICIDLAGHPLPLMTGYRGDRERNAQAMAGGYYHTGDVAARDADGYITYIGRTDDVFKASDYKISPFELESVLIEHPAVAEAAVVPAPDSVRLAVPKAYIALAPGYAPTRETAHDILQHAREELAPYLRVRRIEFFDLPKTISGKIRRVQLRAREVELAEARNPSEWRDDDFPDLKGGAVTTASGTPPA
jgi:acetyl-CoA synthetase